MKGFVSISEFEDDIGSYSRYYVNQRRPLDHMFISASFTEVCMLLSAQPILLFKNDLCEIHIHNIEKVLKTKTNGTTTYTLRCSSIARGGEKYTHTCSIVCQ